MMKRIAERKLAWGFGLALTVLAGNALISYRDLAELSANTGYSVQSRRILEEVEDVASAMKDAEKARRGYLIDRDPTELADFDGAASLVLDEVRGLMGLTAERPAQHERCLALDLAARARLAELRETIHRARDEGIEQGRALFRAERNGATAEDFLALTGRIEVEEARHLNVRMHERR